MRVRDEEPRREKVCKADGETYFVCFTLTTSLEVQSSVYKPRALRMAKLFNPGEIAPIDGTVECVSHKSAPRRVAVGSKFASCGPKSRQQDCAWQYILTSQMYAAERAQLLTS